MALIAGARLGAYETLNLVGEGGMGQVYRARDTRLDRVVAVKVLPEAQASDPDRRERFEREARAVAALNHPHICQLHDVGEAVVAGAEAPIRFLVMEYLEGQTLEERLLRGPLPIADALRIAIELAGALDHAHRRGLVHRDLKPANVMLTATGAKLLDFGLSRLQAPADLTALTTVIEGRAPLTAEGTVLGTYPYMAPEQLTGREADARTDIFAFGAVLYEMVTGERAFAGTTAATVIGAILHTDPPPVSARQSLAPALLDRVVSRCLAKDPDSRWQTARDLVLELQWIGAHPAGSAAAAGVASANPRSRTWLAAALIVLAIAAPTSVMTYLRFRAVEARVLIRLPLAASSGLPDEFANAPVVISPDGRHLVYPVAGSDGRPVLWVRALDALDARPIRDTEGGMYPFWSPDGQSFAFFAQGKLKSVAIEGGPVQILCDARLPLGGAWSRDGVIVFSAAAGHELYRVAAAGGPPTAVPADGINQERVAPSFLADGRRFLYFGRPQKLGLFLGSLDSVKATLIAEDYATATYVPPGYLLFLKGASTAALGMTLLAQKVDPVTLRPGGPPLALADRIQFHSLQAVGHFSASSTGTLVYGTMPRLRTQLMWYDRDRGPLGPVGAPGGYAQLALSRDGTRIAVQRADPVTHASDLWSIQAERGTETRLTVPGNLGGLPVWSPDASRLLFMSARLGPPNLYVTSEGESGGEQRLFTSNFVNYGTDWSRDGSFVVFSVFHPRNGWDLMYLPMRPSEENRKPQSFLATEFDEQFGRVSPDGRWLAYTSDELGTTEVYVQSFPTPGAKVRISTGGGNEPVWRHDGNELFYDAPNGIIMGVSLERSATLRPGTPAPVFKMPIGRRIPRKFPSEPTYAVSNDGRFLLITLADERAIRPTVLFNWPSLLETRE